MSEIKKHRHFILHKPHGYLSQFIVNGKQKKRNKLLGDLYDFPEGTMAIGRLDRDSEGLLLLTTDGKVSYEVLSSKYEKEYYVQVDGIITKEAIKQLRKGVEIGFEGKKFGLSEIISGTAEFQEVIHEIPGTKLNIITAGEVKVDLSDVVTKDQLKKFFGNQ